eukprot:symbB.v1.2.019621.t3/scaffold1614.1/size109413/8
MPRGPRKRARGAGQKQEAATSCEGGGNKVQRLSRRKTSKEASNDGSEDAVCPAKAAQRLQRWAEDPQRLERWLTSRGGLAGRPRNGRGRIPSMRQGLLGRALAGGPWANPAFQRLPSTGDGRQCADRPGKPPRGGLAIEPT